MAPLDLSRNSQEWDALTGLQHKTLKDLRRNQSLGHQQSSWAPQGIFLPHALQGTGKKWAEKQLLYLELSGKKCKSLVREYIIRIRGKGVLYNEEKFQNI